LHLAREISCELNPRKIAGKVNFFKVTEPLLLPLPGELKLLVKISATILE